MKTNLKFLLFLSLILATILIFIFSCVVTLSDGQGALIFIFSIPLMALFLIVSWFLAKQLDQVKSFNLKKITLVISVLIASFFISAPLPVVNKIPSGFMFIVGELFTFTTGKTPYTYFKDRKSFTNLLTQELSLAKNDIELHNLSVTFAWDKLCIFGPYTNNQMAKELLKLDWNIEDRSKIHESDSINALVFLFEGKVNNVIDLNRSLADFENVDTCIDRNQTNYLITKDKNNRLVLKNK